MVQPTLFRRASFVTSVRELHTLPPEELDRVRQAAADHLQASAPALDRCSAIPDP